jgi:hypothetical protein
MVALLGECRKGCEKKTQGLRSELGALMDELGTAIVAPGSNAASVARLKEGLRDCVAIDLSSDQALARAKETLSQAVLEARRLRGSGATMAGPFRFGAALLGDANTVGITRPSCLECVEKHLGAAWVLVTETRNGYPHRTMAVGHLHEAEDESQEYPELHNAVRDARKKYQTEDVMPDWTGLRKLLDQARKG